MLFFSRTIGPISISKVISLSDNWDVKGVVILLIIIIMIIKIIVTIKVITIITKP